MVLDLDAHAAYWAECAPGPATIASEKDALTEEDLQKRFSEEPDPEVRKMLARSTFGKFKDRLARAARAPRPHHLRRPPPRGPVEGTGGGRGLRLLLPRRPGPEGLHPDPGGQEPLHHRDRALHRPHPGGPRKGGGARVTAKRPGHGFTLLEVMIALSILAAAMVGISNHQHRPAQPRARPAARDRHPPRPGKARLPPRRLPEGRLQRLRRVHRGVLRGGGTSRGPLQDRGHPAQDQPRARAAPRRAHRHER